MMGLYDFLGWLGVSARYAEATGVTLEEAILHLDIRLVWGQVI